MESINFKINETSSITFNVPKERLKIGTNIEDDFVCNEFDND